ncbi:DNA/RNA non-specific endonuclease [Desulfuromonas acetoxidans]|nr:DNA/RNA non-specific endonuclease [Desulfuromonas acetoxidans]NVD23680.1 DNA/RNA non-specific endonuclease [Desulfuromonas acetoxidans]NVE15935.1 DNA/RNA non-specific endonuclease [Desulfuromonas acetoxidans]
MSKSSMFFLSIFILSFATFAQAGPLTEEHVLGGLPSNGTVLERNAYVVEYDTVHKAPRWLAYHLVPGYRDVPKRTGKWATYRNDPDLTEEPSDNDYSGVFQDEIRNYAHGHLAPYFISGGDRDGDGKLAEEDTDDKETVYQINYQTNLTPQHHNAFNGSGGVWYELETRIREDLLNEHGELWVFVGTIFGPGSYDVVGDNVHVAPLFFQIVAWKDENGAPQWEAYLLPHHQKAHGDPEDYLVSVRHIEALTGLNFFPDFDLQNLKRKSTAK